MLFRSQSHAHPNQDPWSARQESANRDPPSTHRLEEIPQGFDHVAIMGRITGNEADAYADNVAGNDPAPGTIVYTGDLEHGFTSERLSQVFGLDLKVTHANGRWNAYAV